MSVPWLGIYGDIPFQVWISMNIALVSQVSPERWFSLDYPSLSSLICTFHKTSNIWWVWWWWRIQLLIIYIYIPYIHLIYPIFFQVELLPPAASAARNQTMQSQGDSLAVVRGLSDPGLFRRGILTDAMGCPWAHGRGINVGEALEDAVRKYLNINRNWWELCKTPRRIGYNIKRYAERIIGIN